MYYLFVLKALFLLQFFFPLLASLTLEMHSHIGLLASLTPFVCLFVCFCSVFFPSFPPPTYFVETCTTFPVLSSCCVSPHAATTGIDQTSVFKMKMIIHTTAAVTVQPLLWSPSVIHLSFLPIRPFLHFLLNVILLPQHSHMGCKFTSFIHHK